MYTILLTERNILFTEPPTNLNNYLVSNAYLEYSAFLLSDIEYFLLYTDIPTKASKFSQVEKRFQDIQELILKSRNHYLSSNTAFHKPFKLHFDYLNWFYDVTLKEFNETLKTPDESGIFDKETLDVIETSYRFFDALQAYLPMNHNEFFIYESNKLSSKAFTIASWQAKPFFQAILNLAWSSPNQRWICWKGPISRLMKNHIDVKNTMH
jgi:hypothetical protein